HQCGQDLLRVPHVERSRPSRVATLEQQQHPRDRAVLEIRDKHAPKSPVLEVRTLNIRTEQDSVAVGHQSVAKFDVLDLRARKSLLVEHASREQRRPAYRTASSPERFRVTVMGKMNVMVQQIAIL